jgi:hypothetical protein
VCHPILFLIPARPGEALGPQVSDADKVTPAKRSTVLCYGGSIKDAQAQLGHTKLSTTLEIYTLPIPAHQRAAVETLARMVTNGDEREPSAEGLPKPTQQIQ